MTLGERLIVVVSGDPRDAEYLRVALELGKRKRRESGGPPLPIFDADVRLAASHGQRRTQVGDSVGSSDDVLVSPQLLTLSDVAGRLQRSEKTIGRLRKSGELPTVMVGRTPMVRAADLDDYVANLPIVTRESA